jgi:NitT/TauT family transport system ATP-binding protein
MQPMIDLQAVTFRYADPRPVFEGFDWHVERGATWAVLGPSGCGKSTLLRLLAGLEAPQAGAIAVDGRPLERPRPRTGLILQEYGLLPWATLEANVALGLRIRRFYGPDGRHAPRGRGIDRTAMRTRVRHWLERLGIAEIARSYPRQVSGGQRQRAAVARALVLQPDLLLMDEPFSALDAPTRERMQVLTLHLAAEAGATVILVTHNVEEAAFVGQRILILSHPPNHTPRVVSNPHRADNAYRESAAYQTVCAHLRTVLHQAEEAITL